MTSRTATEDVLAHGIAIRDAQRNDVPRIVAMFRQDEFTSKHIAERSADVEPGYYDVFDAISRDERNRLLVADAGGAVVGAFQLTFIPDFAPRGRDIAIIENVIVDAAHRSRGVGATMMRWAIEEARSRGCSKVALTSNDQRQDAHRFYRRLGFTDTHAGFRMYFDSA
jgi:GNAT superfamily N-acetyltransferase